jgi:lysophospholipase L1-like esterase
MKITLIALATYVVLQFAYSSFFSYRSKEFIKRTYTTDQQLGSGPSFTMYVAGDSIATGVGATSFEKSLVGQVATELAKNHQVNVKNDAVNGYRMAQLASVADPQGTPDLILLSISSNDLFHFTNTKDFEVSARQVVERYSKLGKTLVIVGPGNVGALDNATPLFLKPFYYLQRPKYVKILTEAVGSHSNAIHVDPEKDYDATGYGNATHPTDRFHLSEEGHRYWANLVIKALAKRGIK